MDALATIAFLCGVVAYSVAGTLFFVDLARRDGAQSAAHWAPRVMLGGALVHSAHIVITSFLTNICPVHSLPFALSLGALVNAGLFLLIRSRAGISPMGVAVAPFALTFLVSAQFVGERSIELEVPPLLLGFHVAANLLGLGMFVLAGAAGAFYLIQEARLKSKRFALSGTRLPALDLLDLTEHRLLLAGFPLLTFGVVTGVLFVDSFSGMSGAELWRVGLAYLSWLLVASVLVLRAVAGWRGRKTAYGTLAGLFFVLLVVAVYVIEAGGSGA